MFSRTEVISAAVVALVMGWAGAASTPAQAADYGCWGGWHRGCDLDVGPPAVIERRTVVERPAIIERRVIERRVIVARPPFIERRTVVVEAPPAVLLPAPACDWC
jgi:hypothetical protein